MLIWGIAVSVLIARTGTVPSETHAQSLTNVLLLQPGGSTMELILNGIVHSLISLIVPAKEAPLGKPLKKPYLIAFINKLGWI